MGQARAEAPSPYATLMTAPRMSLSEWVHEHELLALHEVFKAETAALARPNADDQ